MYANQSSAKPLPEMATGVDTDASPILAELTKKMHFFRFLQKEISTVKTEAEKEAVFSILMKTKVQIRALKLEWQEIQKMEQSLLRDSQQASNLYPAHRIQ
jgi:DNA topoisomerase VI subunit B